MGTGDTSLGGQNRDFPRTQQEMVARFGSGDATAQRGAFEQLFDRYWKPVYCYVRIAWSKSNEDAKDLTQAFFAWLMEGDVLAGYDASRAGFRTFLKMLLQRFVGHQETARKALKRGGGAHFSGEPPIEDLVEDPRSADPAEAFDRAWVAQVVEHATGRVRARLQEEGRGAHFRLFERHDLCGEEEVPSYAELASESGLREGQVKEYLASVRREVRAAIRGELARLTADDDELRREWLALFGE